MTVGKATRHSFIEAYIAAFFRALQSACGGKSKYPPLLTRRLRDLDNPSVFIGGLVPVCLSIALCRALLDKVFHKPFSFPTTFSF